MHTMLSLTLIKTSVNSNMNCVASQLAEGVNIVMPKSVVRTISLQKLKQPTPLQNRLQNVLKVESQNNQKEKMYEKILGRKLSTKYQKEVIGEREANNRQIGSKKVAELKEEIKLKQMKQCTFKPQINPTRRDSRTNEEFFNDQLGFTKKKNDKIQEMRIILENNRQKQNIFRPNAFLNTAKSSNNQANNGEVYERLYQDSKNKEKSLINRQQSAQSFKNNSITKSKRFKGISRGTSGEKQNKRQNLQENCSKGQHSSNINTQQQNTEPQATQFIDSVTNRKKSTQISMACKSIEMSKGHRQNKSKEICKRVDVNILEKKDNTKNQEIYIAKLMKQIKTVIQKCKLSLVFTYIEMDLFFKNMNFITEDSPINSRKYLYQIWTMLQGSIFKQVSAISIMKIVYAIMGCHNVNLINRQINDTWLSNSEEVKQRERQLLQQGKKLTFKQNILMLNEKDSKTIKQANQELYLNRLKLGQSELLKQEKAFQYSFRPQISKASNQLAQKYRNRVLCQSEKLIAQNKIQFSVPENGEIDHADLLMLDEKRKEAILQMKREETQRQKRKAQNESLNILSERQSNLSSKSNRDRNKELYQMGKHSNLNKKDKSTDEVEVQKWQQQLTFKPKIKPKSNFVQSLISQQIPDYDKTVFRMLEARKMRTNAQQAANQMLDSSPLLYLNVVMQGCESVKVPIFKNDTLKSMTEKVRVMLDLQQEGGSKKLQRILKQQIMPALKQMGLQHLITE